MVGIFTLIISCFPKESLYGPVHLHDQATVEVSSAEFLVTISLTTNCKWNFFKCCARDKRFRKEAKNRSILSVSQNFLFFIKFYFYIYHVIQFLLIDFDVKLFLPRCVGIYK